MADLADRPTPLLDLEPLTPAAAGRLAPALPTGERLLHGQPYAVCDLVAGRAVRSSSVM